MPPMYTWADKKSGTIVDVLRKVDDCAVPPNEEDGKDIPPDGEWSRIIQAPTVRRGTTWRGSKGNWLILLGLLGGLIGKLSGIC